MKIVKKGMYGYRRWHQFRLMASGILLGLVMYSSLMLSLRISRLPSTILTVLIVLTVIPLSFVIVISFIASCAKTSSEERHAYVQRIEDCGILLCDCIFMTKKTRFPVDFLLITDGKCYVQSCGNAAQQAELKQHLEHYMTADHIGFKVVLGYGDREFFEAADNLPRFLLDAPSEERREKVLKCKHTLLGFSSWGGWDALKEYKIVVAAIG